MTAFGRVIGLYRRLQNQIISQIINKDIRLNHRLFETIAFKNVTVILRLGGKRHLIRHKRNCDMETTQGANGGHQSGLCQSNMHQMWHIGRVGPRNCSDASPMWGFLLRGGSLEG